MMEAKLQLQNLQVEDKGDKVTVTRVRMMLADLISPQLNTVAATYHGHKRISIATVTPPGPNLCNSDCFESLETCLCRQQLQAQSNFPICC